MKIVRHRHIEDLLSVASAVGILAAWGVPFSARADAVGDPDPTNGWDASGAITVSASSTHGTRLPIHTVDGSGLDAAGQLHQGGDPATGDPSPYMWLSSLDAGPVSRGGTVTGSHWIAFTFDQVYDLAEMQIWNDNQKHDDYNWTIQGMKEVTIQCSTTGGTDPAEWAVVYDGTIPQTSGWSPPASPWYAPRALAVDFGGTQAKYVVITADEGSDQNWAGGVGPGAGRVGLSEVRFIVPPPPLTIADNGVAQAAVVVDAGASVSDAYAASELASFLVQVTGASFPVYHALQPGMPNLLVGPVAAQWGDPGFTTAGLGEEGIVIRRAGNHLVLAGAGARGTLYAVYTFLEDHVGVHWWEPNATTVPVRPTLVVNEPDLVHVPPFEYRETNNGRHMVGDWAARNKLNGTVHELEPRHGGRKYRLIAINKHFVHTYWTYLPPEDYFDTHPEWFALYNGQRDARGLDVLNEDMRQEFMANLRTFLLANPQTTLVDISAIDNGVTSQDAASQAIIAQEGSPSGLMLRFVNAIAADMEAEFPALTFSALAYQDTFEAPLVTVPRSNVLVRLTDIHAFFSVPLTDPQNTEFADELADWRAIAHTVYIWDYVADFCHPELPHPNLHVLGPNLQFLAQHGADGVFEEGISGAGQEMGELRTWLLAQLLWDPTRNPQTLIETFANGYYGPAGPHVVAYLDVMHAAVDPDSGYVGPCWPTDAAFLSFETVTAAWAHLVAAEAAVSDDPVLLARVQAFMEPAVNALELHGYYDGITVRASSSHHVRHPVMCINGSGLTPDGLRHISQGDDPVLYGNNSWLSGSLAQSAANPRGGTVPGSHWIEFVFDAPRPLGEMWIWNYHEWIPENPTDWRVMGSRQVTIQYATTGSSNPADWSTVFTGEIPMNPAVAAAPVGLAVDFEGEMAQYVVLTAAAAPSHNWTGGANDESGISEVRFFNHTFTAPFLPTLVPDVVELTFDGVVGYDYRLEYAAHPAQADWSSAGITLQSTGGVMNVSDPAGSAPHKIYRLVVE